ncbi:SHOCT domain-containing protein [Halomonas sp.]|uniref:SHOCT domain-containing protein n=1 Tax=Halomonas sp. TaxID=1486246 RepID=UPI0038500090
MQEKPLSSGQQTGMLIFILMMIPAIGFGGGILAALLMVWGMIMARRNQDFSYIRNTMIAIRWYLYLLALGLFATAVFLWIDSYTPGMEELGFFLMPVIPLISLVLVRVMFYEPLLEHSDWVIKHGIFSNEHSVQRGNTSIGQGFISRLFSRKTTAVSSPAPEQTVTTASIAENSPVDELERWVRLRDANAISEEEYLQAKQALMQRMTNT